MEGDQYSVAIKWEVPSPRPEGVTGYNIYVNGEFNSDVGGSDQTSVLLTGIPRKQVQGCHARIVYVCVDVYCTYMNIHYLYTFIHSVII